MPAAVYQRDMTPSTLSISGRTRLYAILGHPINAVRSPALFNQWFSQSGVDAVCIPVDVLPEQLGNVWRGLSAIANLDGVIVTMPHKCAIVPMLDGTTERARSLGAVNIVRRTDYGAWHGDMCDGEGFVQAIEAQGVGIAGSSAMLVGVGGAGAAIAWALAEKGLKRLYVVDQHAQRVHALREILSGHFSQLEFLPMTNIPDGLELAINATPLGMKESDPLPFDPRELAYRSPHCQVCDVIGSPAQTRLLREAAQWGLDCHSGDAMHHAQARISQRFFQLNLHF